MDKLRRAVEKSGYPLQIRVGEKLRANGFFVHSEWSFVDRDTSELRSVDIRASKRLYDNPSGIRVRPQLDLIIECKSSELPLVFFLERAPYTFISFPYVVGLRSDVFRIYTDDTLSTWSLEPQSVLDLNLDEFASAAPVAFTLSKCQRKSGGDLLLSGDETYNGIVLPLIKALDYLRTAECPPDTAWYFDMHMALGVVVLDAPLVVADDGELTLAPWVRLVRHENRGAVSKNDRGHIWYLDFVHESALAEYLTQHVLPFAERSALKILQHGTELAEGEGFISGMNAGWYIQHEDKLKPKALLPSRGRIAAKAGLRRFRKPSET